MEERDLNEMQVLRELKQLTQELDWLECKDRLLRQTTARTSSSAIWEADTSSRYVELLLKALAAHYVELTMSVTQRYRAW